MAIRNVARTDLHNFVRERWGTDMGDTLMDYLPPSAWPELATKRDLDHAVENLRAELRNHENSINGLKNAITTMVVCNVAMFGVVLTLLWQAR